jgi:hypothetical protein
MPGNPDGRPSVPERTRGRGDRPSDGATVVANVLVATTMALLLVALVALVLLR